MVKIDMAKTIGGLQPVYEDGEKVIRSLKLGEIISVDVVRPRNGAFHDKFFAMLNLIYRNQETYKSMDVLLSVCKLRTGHYDVVETKTEQYKIPKSISFASMDDAEFAAFYDRVCKWVINEVVPGLDRHDLDEEVRNQLLEFGTPEG